MQAQLDAQGNLANGSMVPQGDDARLVVVFRKFAVQNNFKSEQQGRPVFDEIDYINILTPGSTTVVDRPVKQEDKDRFPRSWYLFSQKKEQSLEGTPIDQWARLSVSQIAEAKAANILTVDLLASMSDANVASMGMGWPGLREEAKAFLKKSKDASTAQAYAAENARLKQDIADAHTTIGDLVKRLEALEKKAA